MHYSFLEAWRRHLPVKDVMIYDAESCIYCVNPVAALNWLDHLVASTPRTVYLI